LHLQISACDLKADPFAATGMTLVLFSHTGNSANEFAACTVVILYTSRGFGAAGVLLIHRPMAGKSPAASLESPHPGVGANQHREL